MGFKAGDEKLLYAQLNWVGFHYYTRRIVSDASKEQFLGGGKFSGTEIENNSPGGRDPYTRFRAAMPTEGPLTDAGLEVWPRGDVRLLVLHEGFKGLQPPDHLKHRERLRISRWPR